MIKRIEFTLNLDDPHEAAIYHALRTALKYRRAGEVIRAALNAHIAQPEISQAPSAQKPLINQGESQ